MRISFCLNFIYPLDTRVRHGPLGCRAMHSTTLPNLTLSIWQSRKTAWGQCCISKVTILAMFSVLSFKEAVRVNLLSPQQFQLPPEVIQLKVEYQLPPVSTQ